MNKTKQLDEFIQLLFMSMKKKSESIKDDIKIRFRIKDQMWSAIFLLEYNDLTICTSKNGVMNMYPLTPEENEPKDLITLKDFLEIQLDSKNITFEELQRFLFELI